MLELSLNSPIVVVLPGTSPFVKKVRPIWPYPFTCAESVEEISTNSSDKDSTEKDDESLIDALIFWD